MEDRRFQFAILHPLFSILIILSLAGCQSPPASKSEQNGPLNFSAYLYSLYDTEFTTRPGESLKEDKVTLKPHAAIAVARLGEYAPREALLQQLRAQTNLFSRVAGIPAVIEVPAQATQAKPSPESVKDHILKMRQLATDMGAQYLCLIGGTMQPYLTQEVSGILDLTIIGYFVVPSNRIDVDTRGSSALVDVETGRVVAVVTEQEKRVFHFPSVAIEGSTKQIRQVPPATLEKANAQLEESLTKKLIEHLENRQ